MTTTRHLEHLLHMCFEGVFYDDHDESNEALAAARKELAALRGHTTTGDDNTIRDAGAIITQLRAQLANAEAGVKILAEALAELCETAETASASISPESAFGQVSIVALREVAEDGRSALHQVCGVEA